MQLFDRPFARTALTVALVFRTPTTFTLGSAILLANGGDCNNGLRIGYQVGA